MPKIIFAILFASLTISTSAYSNPYLKVFEQIANPSTFSPSTFPKKPNQYAPSASLLTGKNFDLHQAIRYYADVYNIQPELIAAFIAAESSARPCAYNKSGATGLMQLMPNTAREMGVYGDLFDPSQNIIAGIRYISASLKYANGNIRKAAAHYYGGPNQQNWGRRTKRYANQTIPKKLNAAKRYGWQKLVPSTIPQTSTNICLGYDIVMQ